MILSRGDRDLWVAFQTHPGSQYGNGHGKELNPHKILYMEVDSRFIQNHQNQKNQYVL